MVEASKVRLVRCPKCENLLPEHPDFSVYQCGGCGTFLRGKNTAPTSEGLLEKADGDRISGDSVKKNVDLEDVSESKWGSTRCGLHGTKEKVSNERIDSKSGNSLLRTESQVVSLDLEETKRSQIDSTGSCSKQRVHFGGCVDNGKRNLRILTGNNERGKHDDINMNRPDCVGSRVGNDLKDIGSSIGSCGQGFVRDQQENRTVARHGNARGVAELGRTASFSYPEEGPSSFHVGPSYGCDEQRRSQNNLDERTRLANLDLYRAELLRKLDELKDQLSKSCDVVEQPMQSSTVHERMPPPPTNPCVGHDFALPQNPTSSYGVHVPPFNQDEHVLGSSFFDHNYAPSCNTSRYGLHTQNFYPSTQHVPNEFLGYGHVYQPQMTRKPPHQQPHQFFQRSYHDRFPEYHMNFNQDPHVSHPHETFYHQPSCSCAQCYCKTYTTHQNVPFSASSSQRSWFGSGFPDFCQQIDYARYGYQSCNHKGSNPQPHYWDEQVHARSSSDIDSDSGIVGRHPPRRVILAHGRGRICRSLAGGAPFMTCHNCLELLKIPKKLMLTEKKQKKIICGACSSITSFEQKGKRLAVSFCARLKEGPPEVDDGSDETPAETLQDSHVLSNANVASNLNNCNHSAKFLINAEPNFLSREQGSNHGKSKRIGNSATSASCSSEEHIPDHLVIQRDVASSAELPSKDDASPSPSSSLLQKLSQSSSNEDLAGKHGKGNKSRCIEQVKAALDRTTSQTTCINDISAATEMEVSFHDFLDTVASQDAVEASKEVDQPRIEKRDDSFLGLIKKSFKDFSKSSQGMENTRPSVFVNRQLIPYRLLKKAEKLAGPIQPGDYWYDYRAGFWGIMGQRCFGIIPPFIEEFNYPMPENCAGGDTGIFVNGRELHQNDLDLLAARGLPVMRNKYYLVEISGRVLDEQTGEELENLGKLAPTVEKVGHGFGMKVPRPTAN